MFYALLHTPQLLKWGAAAEIEDDI